MPGSAELFTFGRVASEIRSWAGQTFQRECLLGGKITFTVLIVKTQVI